MALAIGGVVAFGCSGSPPGAPATAVGPPLSTSLAESPAPSSPASAATAPGPSRRALPWSLLYSDGNANRYRFWQDGAVAQYEYVPVRPEESSTGQYSGGQPARGTLTPDQVDVLWREIDALMANPALHSEHRSKGTGMFSITTPHGERRVIVAMGDDLRAFDQHLDAYRGK